MSKKIVLFLLAFGFTAGFAQAGVTGPLAICMQNCQAAYAQCNASGVYTSFQCLQMSKACNGKCLAAEGGP